MGMHRVFEALTRRWRTQRRSGVDGRDDRLPKRERAMCLGRRSGGKESGSWAAVTARLAGVTFRKGGDPVTFSDCIRGLRS